MIKVRDLTVRFGSQTVLNKISLDIPDGKRTIIAGRSGCGKSVLMKTVFGLIKPTEGSVFVDEVDIFSLKRNDLNEIRKKMALLFQGSALFDSMNIYQNVAFPLMEHLKLSEEEVFEEVDARLRLVGLKDVFHKMPPELSGGMKKRAALARAIILNPKYIIYDEPTTGLDPLISSDIIDLIISLHRKYQNTVVIITHDLNCIARTAEHMIVIGDGIIKCEGDYDTFLKSEDPYCKQFIPNY